MYRHGMYTEDFINYVKDLMYFTRKMDCPVMNENAELYWKALCGLNEDGTVTKWEKTISA